MSDENVIPYPHTRCEEIDEALEAVRASLKVLNTAAKGLRSEVKLRNTPRKKAAAGKKR
jgi:hypothetical protein